MTAIAVAIMIAMMAYALSLVAAANKQREAGRRMSSVLRRMQEEDADHCLKRIF